MRRVPCLFDQIAARPDSMQNLQCTTIFNLRNNLQDFLEIDDGYGSNYNVHIVIVGNRLGNL